MAITFSTFRDRLVAMCEAALSGSHAFDVALASSDTYPYWTLEVSVDGIESNDPTHDRYNVTVILRLRRGKLTEGYGNDLEKTCQQDIFNTCSYFRNRRSLTLTAGGSPDIAGMIPRSVTITGRIAVHADTPNQELGSTYTLAFQIGERVTT